MVTTEELRERLAATQEWLLVREEGRTFPLLASEIEISDSEGKRHFGFLDDKGFHSWRLNDAEVRGTELAIDVAGAFASGQEVFRLVPRTPAAELAAELVGRNVDVLLTGGTAAAKAHTPLPRAGRSSSRSGPAPATSRRRTRG